MANDFLGQILGSVLGNSGQTGALGGMGGLGGALGTVFGRGVDPQSDAAGDSPSTPGKGALLAVLLPLAMQWVQRNGGIGAVLQRFRQQGYGQQAASWVSAGENQSVDAQAVTETVGADDLSKLSQQLGVPQGEVAGGLAHILPNVVNHLTPDGEVPANADDLLGAGLASVERYLGQNSS
jgi:uncharacterized protein YidB (DUF937 family)